MSLEPILSIVGPSLTTIGAALLAYDVLRGPTRQARKQEKTDLLVEAKQDHDATARSLAHDKPAAVPREHQAEVAANKSQLASTVGEVNRDYTAAVVREGAQAFRLAIWGLALVVLGGIAETWAAILLAIE
jgi:hypothetical protein